MIHIDRFEIHLGRPASPQDAASLAALWPINRNDPSGSKWRPTVYVPGEETPVGVLADVAVGMRPVPAIHHLLRDPSSEVLFFVQSGNIQVAYTSLRRPWVEELADFTKDEGFAELQFDLREKAMPIWGAHISVHHVIDAIMVTVQ